LESQEFKLLSFVSGVYAYTALGSGLAGIGLILAGGQTLAYGVGLVGLTAFFAIAIWHMWRRKAVSPWLVAAPCILVVVLSLAVDGWRTIGFGLDLLALGAVYALARVWHQMAELPSNSVRDFPSTPRS
jgi:hypothetical protein